MTSIASPSNRPRRWSARLAAASCALALPALLSACWDSASTPATPGAAQSVGGSIAGLTASGLVLANGSDTTGPSAGATAFSFPALVSQGGSYDVTVQAQPAGETCSIANGSGTVGAAPVGTVQVTCVPATFSIGGSITGLTTAGLQLTNGSDVISPVAGATGFTFAQPVASGSTYAVSVTTQPVDATCSVSQATGTVANAAVTNVLVNCAANAFHLGGTIAGLTSDGLVLANGGDTVSPASGALSFSFGRPVAEGGSYAVSVQAQPVGTTCSVSGGSGTMGGADVNGVQVTCSPNAYRIGGTITGLTAAGLVLANGADTVSPAVHDSSFTFANPVAFGGSFSVVVQQQPAGLTCTVAGSYPATMGAGDVTNIAVTCAATTGYSLVAGQGTCPSGVLDVAGVGATASLTPDFLTSDPAGNLYNVTSDRVVEKITPQGTLTILAGQVGVSGSTDGTGAGATFDQMLGVTADSSGTLTLTDDNAIRRVTAGGVVTTLAGVGNQTGFVDGIGNAARFHGPAQVAVDAVGNVYIADQLNHAIRKLTPAGVVSTVAGNGSSGYADGPAASAQFYAPFGVAVDASGVVYVGDTGNHVIRKISPAGIVSTLAGTTGASGFAEGTGAAARFASPESLYLDAHGNLYVDDQVRSIFRQITPAGVVTTLAANSTWLAYEYVPHPVLSIPQQYSGGEWAVNPAGQVYFGLGCSLQKVGP